MKLRQLACLAMVLPSIALAQTQRPTASEVFMLRGECVKLADKISEENPVGSALTKDVMSHYDPNTNRCYVELIVHTAELSVTNPYWNRNLFDGQTRDLLAFAKNNKGEKLGAVVGPNGNFIIGPNGLGANGDFDDANDYINSKMADHRKQ